MAFRLEFRPAGDPPVLAIAEVPWDSEALGLSIWEIRCEGDAASVGRALPAVLADLSSRGRHLAVARIEIGATALGARLAASGFHPIETSFDLSRPLGRPLPLSTRLPRGLALREASAADVAAITAIARHGFACDRYHLEPTIPSDKADERYVRWIERALRDGEPVFVAETNADASAPLGFFHVRPGEDGDVDLSLAALDAAARRAGVGPLLYAAVLEECRRRGFRSAGTRVAAQNLEVLNLFAFLGFSFRRPLFCFHRPG